MVGGEEKRVSVCVCMCVYSSVYVFGSRESTNETVFSQQKGCESMNWTSTALPFHFGDMESPDQTSEATEEQFSAPITAHSSWCDCCITAILLVGSR